MNDYLVEEVDYEVESQKKENSLDEAETIIKVEEWSRGLKLDVLAIGDVANQHHDEDYGGCEEVGKIPEPILVAVFCQKDWKERTGAPGFDRWQVWELVTAGLGHQDEPDQARRHQQGHEQNS